MFINPNTIVRSRVTRGTIALAIYRRPFAYAPRLMSELVLVRVCTVPDGREVDVVIGQDPLENTPLKNGAVYIPTPSLDLANGDGLNIPILSRKDIQELGLQPPDVRSLRRSLASQMVGGTAGSSAWRWPVRALAALGVFYVVTTVLLGPRPKTQWLSAAPPVATAQSPIAVSGSMTGTPPAGPEQPAQPSVESAAGRALSSVALASDALSLPRVTLDDAFAKSTGVRLRTAADATAPTIFVWSDPLCPHCRDLEAKLEALPPTVGITIIPVSFRPGAKVVVSNIVCGPTVAEQSERWTAWMSGKPQGDLSEVCDRGPLVADQNSVMMVRAGLLATPTLAVLRDGKLVTFDGNVDSLTSASLMSWAVKS